MKTGMTRGRIGNALGFTASGETVTGRYCVKTKAWRIEVHSVTAGGFLNLADTRHGNFPDKRAALDYAGTLIDRAKTLELAWWRKEKE
jgi:hypothetical protein